MNIVTPEFRKIVQELIEKLQPDDQFLDAEEYRLARKYNALPMGVDMFSYIFLTSNGEVIGDDKEGETVRSGDSQSLIRVLVHGKSRYPQLAEFVPSRSEDSKTCPVCKGSGVWEHSKDFLTGKPTKCVFCAGLGWLTEEAYLQIVKNSK